MQLIDGKHVASLIQAEIAQEVQNLKEKGQKIPHLAAVLVGNDAPSETYVNGKVKACHNVGFGSTLLRFPDTISETALLAEIEKLNQNPEIDGFIVQLPLPKHIDVVKITEAIDYRKDVDGFHPINVGRMAKNLPAYISATPLGILKLLEYYQIPTVGRHCVVLGRSHIVGSPMSILMARNTPIGNSTVTLCHSKTQNLAEYTRQADILIAAIGIPQFVKADMVKEGAIVIDVGINRIEDTKRKSGFRLVGDVDFEKVAPRCYAITPVPGGVGPMTITALMLNTLLAAQKKVYG
ncbi:MAG: bifunctional 5,10-methylene-tetrahydrofolate dehydrogenase/5,10-methylene-tetrahydrofolate cyclohydrolase [Microscillaceae bacterium]|nr:bifunctional 5,10-methylene-tetrahydrofolate dehydrogenase/5,10-methylene-tetrahydrofolate cyclohydrolase [Microscillaceae bacterium]MDW8460929.1 tetrahydrofolate dehydrogenase/cyclohydrolase catalytic domain-containing protein [Cytophagales bacterium]